LVLLLALSGAPFSASVSAGEWRLESSLNASEARAVLAQLSFTPQVEGAGNAWLVSSSSYLLSDGAGSIGPNATLAPQCASVGASCAASSDLYHLSDGRLVHVGRLHFGSNSIFDSQPGPSNSFGYPGAGQSNQSAPPAGEDLPLTLPQEWLWVIAAGIVLVLTLAFVLRNRD
jgi:hypothetical protein